MCFLKSLQIKNALGRFPAKSRFTSYSSTPNHVHWNFPRFWKQASNACRVCAKFCTCKMSDKCEFSKLCRQAMFGQGNVLLESTRVGGTLPAVSPRVVLILVGCLCLHPRYSKWPLAFYAHFFFVFLCKALLTSSVRENKRVVSKCSSWWSISSRVR